MVGKSKSIPFISRSFTFFYFVEDWVVVLGFLAWFLMVVAFIMRISDNKILVLAKNLKIGNKFLFVAFHVFSRDEKCWLMWVKMVVLFCLKSSAKNTVHRQVSGLWLLNQKVAFVLFQ